MSEEEVRTILLGGSGASVDTRTLVPGEVFFALPGEHTHGALYVAEALARGAAAAVLPEGYPLSHSTLKERVFFHPSPLTFLGKIAGLYRQRFSLPVIAIGGSNGKTTTKALIGHMLSQSAPTLVSPRSWNNRIGVPLTLLRLSSAHRFAVLEIGDNHPGEVFALCEILHPTIGVLTNIGLDHLEGYGDIMANLRGKWELVEYLAQQRQAVLFLNEEDPYLARQALPSSVEVYYYGNGERSIARGNWQMLTWERAQVRGELFGESFTLEVPLWGSYNRLNLLAALAVCHYLGLSLEKMEAALQSFQSEAYRSQVFYANGRLIIMDAYNSNPSSLSMSLSALWESIGPADKVGLILGQMDELGSYTTTAHTQVLASLRERVASIAGVLVVGAAWESALSQPQPFHLIWVKQTSELTEWPSWLLEASVIYLKGSRSQRLESLLSKLGVHKG
ncbi:MAG: UDP-N-acetylmuramoyl-tripeptide--D-alanyl-D-alanine ligase [Bacteroidia bacterium]|nr:UDP-N-acetylmuramoyl-tripeptide--D-alanyl-D-alanine ligase [Bacteroidia bacterium]MDW8016067.1 UDP-N-acetylmuramoyl-tripeptide--D-alanyl-D-alanine ligase [Bacteroidia bacterium]